MFSYYKSTCRRILRRHFTKYAARSTDLTFEPQDELSRPQTEKVYHRGWIIILFIPVLFFYIEVTNHSNNETENKIPKPVTSPNPLHTTHNVWEQLPKPFMRRRRKYKTTTSRSKRRRHERVANNDWTGTFSENQILNAEEKINQTICVINATNLPPIKLNMSRIPTLVNVYPDVQEGGYYKPKDCYSRNKVAILVPYRNRAKYLTTFLYNIHPILMAQKLEYRVFVIEQYEYPEGVYTTKVPFNKGRLLNAGFREMKRYGWWRCVVLHDVDLLPLSPRILYSCPPLPRHMSSMVINHGFAEKKEYRVAFGGVISMSVKHYEEANGYSNAYWGSNGVDFDLFQRLRAADLQVLRYNRTVGRYLGMPHARVVTNPTSYRLMKEALERWQYEGLNTARYLVHSVILRSLFTHIVVKLDDFTDFGIYQPAKPI